MQVELPFDSFVGIMRATRPDIFDPRKPERIMIFQGLDNGKPHTVYIDEITIDDAQPASVRLPLLCQDKQSALSEAVSASTRAMSDDELLTMVQEACFRYYWEAAHPNVGMAIGHCGPRGTRIHHPRARPAANAENHAFSVDRCPVSRRLATFPRRAHRQSNPLLR
jgi:hypothetical protein